MSLSQQDGQMEHSRASKPLVVSCTGFSSSEKAWVQSMCQVLGATYKADLQANAASHLVCRSMVAAVNNPKYTRALQWGVKVVSWQWLMDSAAVRHPLPAARFKTDPCQPFPSAPAASLSLGSTSHPQTSAQPRPLAHTPPHQPAACDPSSCAAPARSLPDSQPRASVNVTSQVAALPAAQPTAPADFTFASIRPPLASAQPGPWQLASSMPVQQQHHHHHQSPAGLHLQSHGLPTDSAAVTPDLRRGPQMAGAVGGVRPETTLDAWAKQQDAAQEEEDMDLDGIIPGTQMMDDDDDDELSTPQSLCTFLQARAQALGGTGTLSAGAGARQQLAGMPQQAPSSVNQQPQSLPLKQQQQAQHGAERTPVNSAGASSVQRSPLFLSPSVLESSASDGISISSASPGCQDTDDLSDAMLVSPAPSVQQSSALRVGCQEAPALQMDQLSIQCLFPVRSRTTTSPTDNEQRLLSDDNCMMISPLPAAQRPVVSGEEGGEVCAASRRGPGVLYSGFGSSLGSTPQGQEQARKPLDVHVAEPASACNDTTGRQLSATLQGVDLAAPGNPAPAVIKCEGGIDAVLPAGPMPASPSLNLSHSEGASSTGRAATVKPAVPPPVPPSKQQHMAAVVQLMSTATTSQHPHVHVQVKQEPYSPHTEDVGAQQHQADAEQQVDVPDVIEDSAGEEEDEEDELLARAIHALRQHDHHRQARDAAQQSDQCGSDVAAQPKPQPSKTAAPTLSLKHMFGAKSVVEGSTAGGAVIASDVTVARDAGNTGAHLAWGAHGDQNVCMVPGQQPKRSEGVAVQIKAEPGSLPAVNVGAAPAPQGAISRPAAAPSKAQQASRMISTGKVGSSSTSATSPIDTLHQRVLPPLLLQLEQQQAGRAGSSQESFLNRAVSVTVVKPLARAPRASTAKSAHALSSSTQARFCEQLELQVCSELGPLLLVARDKAKQASLPVLRRLLDTQGRPVAGGGHAWVVAEPVTFYCLKADGSWWMEFCELLTSEEAQRRAAALGVQCALPPDMHPSKELLRDVCCQHARLSQVLCTVPVSRSKRITTKLPPSVPAPPEGTPNPELAHLMQEAAGLQLHQRYEFDSSIGAVVTKEPSTTYILDH